MTSRNWLELSCVAAGARHQGLQVNRRCVLVHSARCNQAQVHSKHRLAWKSSRCSVSSCQDCTLLTRFVFKYTGFRFAVALQHLQGHHYPLQTFSGAFELDSDWLNLVGVPLHQKHANPSGYERPPLPIDCDVLRMTLSLPSDDSNYNL